MPSIILYDVLSRLKPPQWSSNALRTRIALNYLRIPYETVWLSYPDIGPTLAGLGVPPSNPDPKGKGPTYTVPTIRHGDTFVVGTMKIAEYLASNFPPSETRPDLFPHHSLPLARFAQSYLANSVLLHARKVVLPRVPSLLDDRGAEYFRRTRAEWLGVPLEQYHADPEEQERIWRDVDRGLAFLSEVLTDVPDGPFILGKVASYADLQIVAVLYWIRNAHKDRWEGKMSKQQALRALWDAGQRYLF